MRTNTKLLECDFTKLGQISRFRVVFIVLAVTRKYYGIFIVLRAPEHRETTYFWKVEDHNFHHVLIRSNFIKKNRGARSVWVRKSRNFLGPKKSKNFDLEIFHFHTIFNENFRSQKFSKNLEN